MRIFLYVALSVSCASPLPNSAVCRQIECEEEEKNTGAILASRIRTRWKTKKGEALALGPWSVNPNIIMIWKVYAYAARERGEFEVDLKLIPSCH